MNRAAASDRERLGFRDGEKGIHSSRTFMFAELKLVLAGTSVDAGVADFRRAVVQENLLGKRTATNREHTVWKLKALYALDPLVPVYRVLRRLWEDDEAGQPLLALLCAVARDPLLRASVDLVLDTPTGQDITKPQWAATVAARFSDSTRDAIVSHLASTWVSSGFLTGRSVKTRTRPEATPGAAAYALALGYMEGSRGSLLLSTPWTRLLDRTPDGVLALVRQAARRGWVEYRAAGDVVDLRVESLFTDEERGWCDGQPD